MTAAGGADDPAAEYARRLAERRAQIATFEALERRISAARGATFLAALAILWTALGMAAISVVWILAPIAVFAALALRHERVIRERRRTERAAAHYEQGLARVEDRRTGRGDAGERFLAAGDATAEDLDLFGRGSLFELLSVAKTRIGEGVLAGWLRAPAGAEEIRGRQQAGLELRSRLDLREDLSLLGSEARAAGDPDALLAWAEQEPIAFPRGTRVAAGLLSMLTIAAIVVWQIELGPPAVVPIAIGLQALFARRLRGQVDRALHGFDEAARELGVLSDVLARFEREPFEGARLAALRDSLESEGLPPSRRIAGLARRSELLDSQRNQIFAIPAAILLWRTQLAVSIERWRAHHGRAVRRWIEAIGELEALLSIAGYGYEHPRDPFPEIVEGEPLVEAEEIAHPLLPEARATRNDLRLGGELRLLVVSGSNMSGKSTLLRTVGTNVALALAGAPVRARRFRLSPLALGTSIRVRDSLQEGRSRFYAEITRLREILDLARAGPLPVLFLLDEILAGTNSHDRRIGAEGVIRGFLERGAIGLVTTHDLALAEIAESLAPRAANVHFEDHLEDGRIAFDYRLREGIVRKSNALALMRAVGLEVD
jgi:hypothetical protein